MDAPVFLMVKDKNRFQAFQIKTFKSHKNFLTFPDGATRHQIQTLGEMSGYIMHSLLSAELFQL